MPVIKTRTAFEIARDIRAFLNLEAGLIRGQLPNGERDKLQKQRLERMREQLSKKNEQLKLMQRRLSESDQRVVAEDKEALIDFTCRGLEISSVADLGGAWEVNGKYTFYAMEKHKIQTAFLVDVNPTDAVMGESKKYPGLKVIKGDFGDKEVAEQVRGVDAVILFDVLLHQVAPDWDEILEMYSDGAKAFIIYNQQFVASDSTVRLLDLGEEQYFRNVPHTKDEEPYRTVFEKEHEIHPQAQRPYRDLSSIWQWGIVDDDLIAKMRSLGFTLQYFKNCGQFLGLNNFENHAFVFTKDRKLGTVDVR